MRFWGIIGEIFMLTMLLLAATVVIVRAIIDYAARRFPEKAAKQKEKAFMNQADCLAERMAQKLNTQRYVQTDANEKNT